MNSADLTKLHDDYLAAWRRDDRETAMSLWTDAIVMRAAGSNQHSGLYRGKAEVRQNLIGRIHAETTEAEALGLVDRGIGSDHVFTIVQERFTKADGRVFKTKQIVIYRWAEEKMVEVFYFDPDQPVE